MASRPTPTTPGVGAAGCANGTLTASLNGANDWNALVLAFRQFGDSESGAIDPVDETGSPTDEDLQRMADEGRTTNLVATLSATPDPVASGTTLSLRAEVRNAGPNPAGAVWLTATVPPETQRSGAIPPACTEPAPGTLRCSLGEMLPGAVQGLDLTALLPADLVYVAGSPFPITASAEVEDLAGIESLPADNAVTATVTAVAVADLSVADLSVRRPPLRMRTGESVVVHLQSRISSVGPSSPMDARTTLTAKADAGASVTPTWLESFDLAVRDGDTRIIDDWPIVSCRERGLHSIDFATGHRAGPCARHRSRGLERPLRDLADGRLHRPRGGGGERDAGDLPQPRRAPVPRNPGWRSCRRARGEYGRGTDFDARSIDPDSLRVGSRRMVDGSEPGDTAFAPPETARRPGTDAARKHGRRR